jgi:hypothetical protein
MTDFRVAASGSIVHPLVFFLMDTYRAVIRGDGWIRNHEKHLKALRVLYLPVPSLDPWAFGQGYTWISHVESSYAEERALESQRYLIAFLAYLW